MKKINNHNWKITVEQYGCKYSIELDKPDVTIENVYDALKQILAASGWHYEQIKEILNIDEL
jgi:hypothetical protein